MTAVLMTALRHPEYELDALERELWRNTHCGGRVFVDRYLIQFSKRETLPEFKERQRMSYCPGHAETAVSEVGNSIYDRMPDIVRDGGSITYKKACTGEEGGVDLESASMNYFIGKRVLPEMLAVKRVGVFVDMPRVEGMTILDVTLAKARPYFYLYESEEICNWLYDYSQSNRIFTKLLLREETTQYDDYLGLPSGTRIRYRYLWVENGKCYCKFFNDQDEQQDMQGQPSDIVYDIGMPKIPFVMFEIPESMYKNTAQMQVALMNMESSDINYVLKANFPFYVEQNDPRPFAPQGKQEGETGDNGEKVVEVGTNTGRSYSSANAPSFIHPSSEPLVASMKKQQQMKEDIRLLTHLTLSVMHPTKTASSDSKRVDNQGLEAGLAFLGLELEKGERQLAEFWGLYEKQAPASILYPTTYSLKSDAERRDDADFYEKKIPTIPSITYQKCAAKVLARNVLGHKVTQSELAAIYKEIDAAPFMVVDPVTTQQDVDRGILDRGNAAKARLYPDDAVAKANTEQADRLAQIAASQAPTNVNGVTDTQVDPKGQQKDQKTVSRSGANDPIPGDKTRGAGQ